MEYSFRKTWNNILWRNMWTKPKQFSFDWKKNNNDNVKIDILTRSSSLISLSSSPFEPSTPRPPPLLLSESSKTWSSFIVMPSTLQAGEAKKVWMYFSWRRKLWTRNMIYTVTQCGSPDNTRSSTKFHIPLIRTNASKLCIFYKGQTIWNNLNNNIISSPSLNTFKCRLKSTFDW